MKNLLKISFIFFVSTLLYACENKPTQIPEEIKEAFGYYAYNKYDTISLLINRKDSNDTILVYLKNKALDTIPNFDGISFYENLILELVNNHSDFYVFAECWSIDSYMLDISNFDGYILGATSKMIDYYPVIEIDGVNYDNVYHIQDADNNMFSSKDYGFIKIWNDTISYKFVR